MRLFCFPHAGGNAAFYRTWGDALGSEIEILAVEYPGRLSRFREEPLADLDRLVTALLDDAGSEFCGSFALFGFSYGSLVAFEVARALRRRGLSEPWHLFVAGRGAPQLPSAFPQLHVLSDDQFVQGIERLYGDLPSAIRSSPELLRMALRALRADVAALERYVCKPELALSYDITAVAGEGDPVAEPDALRAWSRNTAAGFHWQRFPGGHFFMDRSEHALLSLLRARLLAPQDGHLETRPQCGGLG